MNVTVRPAARGDAAAWLRMREALWPNGEADHAREVEQYFHGQLDMPLGVLLAIDAAGGAVGFVELSIRRYAEGCETDRVAYLEGWYVDEPARRGGVGRALIEAAERWAGGQGCTEFASDALVDNATSAAAHNALGFTEVESVRCFHKRLSGTAVVKTRLATPADRAAIANLHVDSIRTIGPRFYAADVVDAWAAAVTPALYVSAMAAGEVFFVALDPDTKGRLVGFSSHLVTDGVHGVSVYVRGSVEGRGVGSTLLRLAEARAAAEGAREIEILASLPGLPFYSRHGFQAVGPRDVTFGGRGVSCIAMRKPLATRA